MGLETIEDMGLEEYMTVQTNKISIKKYAASSLLIR